MKCSECKHLIAGISQHNNSRSNWWCAIARTVCEPHRRIAQAMLYRQRHHLDGVH